MMMMIMDDNVRLDDKVDVVVVCCPFISSFSFISEGREGQAGRFKDLILSIYGYIENTYHTSKNEEFRFSANRSNPSVFFFFFSFPLLEEGRGIR